MKFEKVNKNVYLRFFISYVVILMIPIIAVLFAFNKSIIIAEQDVKEYALLMLEQSKNTVESKMMELDNMVQQIALDGEISSLIDRDRTFGNTQFDYYKSVKELKNFKLTNDFIDSIFLILKNENVVISDEYAIRDLSFFYELNLKYNDMSFLDWHDNIWSKYYHSKILSSEEITRNGKKEKVVTYMQSLPFGSITSDHGIILILIKESDFKKHINTISKQGSWVYIADDKGEIITSASSGSNPVVLPKNLQKANADKNLLIQYTVSNYNKWTYAAAYPLNTIMSRVNYIKTITAIVIFIAVLGGIFTALLFTRNNSKPITQLMDRNKILNEAMKAKLPILRTAFLDRLFKGGFNTFDEVKIAYSSLEMELDYQKYLVVLLKVNGYKHINNRDKLSELNIFKFIVLDTAIKLLDSRAHLHELEGDKIAVLYAFDYEEQNEIEQKIELFAEKIYQSIKDDYKINLGFGAGTLCNSLLEVYKSYYEAKEAIEYNIADEGKLVTWYEKVSSKVSHYYYYPFEIENKIINLVRAGDINQINYILDELYTENIKKRVLTKVIVKFLIDDMKGTVVKTISQLKVNDKYLESKIVEDIYGSGNSESIEEFIVKLKNVYYDLCVKCFSSSKNNDELKSKLMDYLNANFQEPDLNLCMAASQFNMNEKYYSRLFKELTGITFSQYLEEKRLSEAKELLDRTDLTVNDISEKVGYTSAHAFRRAFKRVYGVLPTSFRISDMEIQTKL